MFGGLMLGGLMLGGLMFGGLNNHRCSGFIKNTRLDTRIFSIDDKEMNIMFHYSTLESKMEPR